MPRWTQWRTTPARLLIHMIVLTFNGGVFEQEEKKKKKKKKKKKTKKKKKKKKNSFRGALTEKHLE